MTRPTATWIIELIVQVAAMLVVVLAPHVEAAPGDRDRPTATIVGPRDGETIIGEFTDSHGTARNVPVDHDVWLVMRPWVEGRWYPVERINR